MNSVLKFENDKLSRPAQAQKYLKLGLSSLADLRANVDKLNHQQRIGLKYVEDFEARIPRQEMDEINELLTQQIKSVDGKFSVTLCGSYRRGKSFEKL
jgi:hypothetical protein